MPVIRRQAAVFLAAALFLAVTSEATDGSAAPREHAPRIAAKGGKKPATKAAPKKGTGAHQRVEALPPRAPLAIDLPLFTRHLAGGVLVIAVPSATAQVVAVTVIEGAGASSDPIDRGGLASLRARLDGTRATAERRTALVAERGGESSLDVEAEQIVSRYVLPAGELALPLWLERDRLEARVSEETLVGSLRAMTEARESDRAARHRSALDGLMFSGYAPYAHEPDGKADELLAIRNDAVAGTLAPRPARPVVVVIAGAITAEAALLEADRELAGVEARPAAAAAGALPDQTNQREAAGNDARATTGTLWLGYAIPAGAEADHAAIEVAATILANGPRSRLERALIDDGIARRGHAVLDRRRGPSALRLEVELAAGADAVRAREVTERTILELAKASPPPDEVRRAIAWLASEHVRELSDPATLSTDVARMAIREPDAFAGPKGSVRADLDRWNATDGDAVARVVKAHLSPIRRCVFEVKPEHPLEAPIGPSLSRPQPTRSQIKGGGAHVGAGHTTPHPKGGAKPAAGSKPAPSGKPAPAVPGPGKAPRGPAKRRGKP